MDPLDSGIPRRNEDFLDSIALIDFTRTRSFRRGVYCLTRGHPGDMEREHGLGRKSAAAGWRKHIQKVYDAIFASFLFMRTGIGPRTLTYGESSAGIR